MLHGFDVSMKILITGGAGFIGYHLAKYLADRGDDVVVCDNFARGEKDKDFQELVSRPNVELVICDLTKTEELKKIGTDYDSVYHLSAINHTELFYKIPAEIMRVGIMTTMNILEWMRKQDRKTKIIFTSSSEAYAGALKAFGQLPIPTPENVPLVIEDVRNPRWSYAGTKLIGELLFLNYAKQYGLRVSIVRPNNFYGPRAGIGHVVPDFIERILGRQNPFHIYGNDTRSFCYIDDAIRQMVAVMETEKTDGEIVSVGNAEEIKIIDLAKKLFDVANYHPEVVIYDSPLGSVKRRLPDLSKLYNLTGVRAEVDLEEGLTKTFKWYKTHPQI